MFAPKTGLAPAAGLPSRFKRYTITTPLPPLAGTGRQGGATGQVAARRDFDLVIAAEDEGIEGAARSLEELEGKAVEVNGWRPRDEALAEIDAARERLRDH